jgi:hypothetical protein
MRARNAVHYIALLRIQRPWLGRPQGRQDANGAHMYWQFRTKKKIEGYRRPKKNLLYGARARALARRCAVLYCAAASEMVEGAYVPSYCVLLYPHNDLPHLLIPTSNCRGCFAHDGDGRKRRLSRSPRTEKGRQDSVPFNLLCWGWVSPYMQDGRCVHALASCTVSPFVLQRGATQLMEEK